MCLIQQLEGLRPRVGERLQLYQEDDPIKHSRVGVNSVDAVAVACHDRVVRGATRRRAAEASTR